MITTDENNFIIDYKVMIGEEDVEQPVELINRIVNNFGNNSVQSISFDRGFRALRSFKQ